MTDIRDDMIRGLQHFAKAVCVITAEHAGRRVAMTATAVCEVSLDPPTLLVCVSNTASISALMREGDRFAVNVLSADQQEIASACAGKLLGDERFSKGTWIRHEPGYWLLEGSQAVLMCSHSQRVEAGSHTVFIGRVDKVTVNEVAAPLVYLNRSYVTLPRTAL
jgi:flavin reductase (DIM6/NTAB) family NADH-FMN oxidoreductase RutF